MKGGPNLPQPPADVGNVAPEDVATNQEGIVTPWHCGEAKHAVQWITPIYDEFTKQAPAEAPAKK